MAKLSAVHIHVSLQSDLLNSDPFVFECAELLSVQWGFIASIDRVFTLCETCREVHKEWILIAPCIYVSWRHCVDYITMKNSHNVLQLSEMCPCFAFHCTNCLCFLAVGKTKCRQWPTVPNRRGEEAFLKTSDKEVKHAEYNPYLWFIIPTSQYKCALFTTTLLRR